MSDTLCTPSSKSVLFFNSNKQKTNTMRCKSVKQSPKNNDEKLEEVICLVQKYLGHERFKKFVYFCQMEKSKMATSIPFNYDMDINTAFGDENPEIVPGQNSIQVSFLQLDEQDYGPRHLAPDCYVHGVSEIEAAILVNTPLNFDPLATNCGETNLDFAFYDRNDLVPITIDGWNI